MKKDKIIKKDLRVNITFELNKTREKQEIDKDCGCDLTYDAMACEIMNKVTKSLKTIKREGKIAYMACEIMDKKKKTRLVLMMGG